MRNSDWEIFEDSMAVRTSLPTSTLQTFSPVLLRRRTGTHLSTATVNAGLYLSPSLARVLSSRSCISCFPSSLQEERGYLVIVSIVFLAGLSGWDVPCYTAPASHACLLNGDLRTSAYLGQALSKLGGRRCFSPPFRSIPNDIRLALETALIKVAFIEVEAFGNMSSFTFDIR